MAAVLATAVEGFAPTLRSPGIPSLSKAPACAKAPRLRSLVAPKMGYFEDLAKKEADRASMDGKGNVIMPDADYTGFVDAEDGFDGGDGQVGVVGDGSNAMETFDNREVISASSSGGVPAAGIGGREEGTAGKYGASGGNRVDKRWNAWGTGTCLPPPCAQTRLRFSPLPLLCSMFAGAFFFFAHGCVSMLPARLGARQEGRRAGVASPGGVRVPGLWLGVGGLGVGN
jgi:hypothetical protein